MPRKALKSYPKQIKAVYPKGYKRGIDRPAVTTLKYIMKGPKKMPPKIHDVVINQQWRDNGTDPVTDTQIQDASYATTSLSLIPSGTGYNKRTGQFVEITGIYGRLKLASNIRCEYSAVTSMAMLAKLCKYWLVVDKQANGVQADFDDLLTNSADITSFTKPENTDRFKILKTGSVVLSPVTNTAYQTGGAYYNTTGDIGHLFEFSLPKVKIPIDFGTSAGTPTIANISSNNLFLMLGYQICPHLKTPADSTTYIEGTTHFAGNIRVRFKDC